MNTVFWIFLALSILFFILKKVSDHGQTLIIQRKSEKAVPLEDFADYVDEKGWYSKITVLHVSRNLRNKYDLILVDLDKENPQKIYTYKKLLIINVEIMIFALEKNAPIIAEFDEKKKVAA